MSRPRRPRRPRLAVLLAVARAVLALVMLAAAVALVAAAPSLPLPWLAPTLAALALSWWPALAALGVLAAAWLSLGPPNALDPTDPIDDPLDADEGDEP